MCVTNISIVVCCFRLFPFSNKREGKKTFNFKVYIHGFIYSSWNVNCYSSWARHIFRCRHFVNFLGIAGFDIDSSDILIFYRQQFQSTKTCVSVEKTKQKKTIAYREIDFFSSTIFCEENKLTVQCAVYHDWLSLN